MQEPSVLDKLAFSQRMIVSRDLSPETPYRARYGGETYELFLGSLIEDESYDPGTDRQVPHVTVLAWTEPMIRMVDAVAIYHVLRPSVIIALHVVSSSIQGASQPRHVHTLRGYGSLITLGPLPELKDEPDIPAPEASPPDDPLEPV